MNVRLQIGFIIGSIAIAAVVAAGCNKSASPTSEVTPAPPVPSFGPPPTEEECRQFARDLEATAKANDTGGVNGCLRMDDLMLRSVSDVSLGANERERFMAGARQALQGGGLGGQICELVQAGGSYHFLRYHTTDNRPRVLFRMLHAGGGLNYHDIVVARFPDGRLGAEDIYVAATGEFLSQTLRRLLLPLVQQLNRNAFSRLTGSDKEFLDNAARIQDMARALRERRAADAATAYRQLPQSLQNDKSVLIIYLQAAQALGDEEYSKVTDTIRRLYPNDPCIDFVSIDYHLIRKDYPEALKSVDGLERAMGKDAYLSVLRGNILAEAGRLAEAHTAAEKAVADEPTLLEAYWSVIGVTLKQKNHTDTLAWLKKAVEKCGAGIDDLTKLPDYAEFVKSPQHQEWLKWYSSRTKD